MADRTYEVRIEGPVPSDDLLVRLGAAGVAEHELHTVLRGRFRDQAELHAFLALLRSYGIEVLELRRVPADGPGDDDGGGA